MRLVASILFIAILAAVCTWYLPWWMIAVVSAVVAFVINMSNGKAFLSGFFGIGLCWTILILNVDIKNDHILSSRMADLFSLPGYGLFIAVNVLVGAFVGGLAAWSGAALRNGFMK
ncbi:MAG TPA: hypothetical protein VEB40_09280 [Flavipsychrobacter sp.]|nr:hypothetical protein [Flavipsychrobacter sp.]